MALTELQRRFVVEWFIGECRDAATAARRAGVSDAGEGCKVYASRALRNEKVVAAIREESGRHLGALTGLAVMNLKRSLRSNKPQVYERATESVLDRGGFGRSTTQDIRVEHVDSRSTAELLKLAQQFSQQGLLPAPKIIDVTPEKV